MKFYDYESHQSRVDRGGAVDLDDALEALEVCILRSGCEKHARGCEKADGGDGRDLEHGFHPVCDVS